MSNTGFVPRRPSTANSARSSRSVGAFNLTNPNNELEQYMNRLEGHSPSTMQEISGGTEGERQIRETTPSYQAALATARQAGIEGPPRDQGALETLANWLGRSSSAVTGAITGALGRTRYTEEGADFVNPGERGSAALRRLREGWGMETYYSWSQFGSLAKKRSEGGELQGWESAYNFGKGLILDTISDPLTYVSFGGSILGRVGSSPIVRSKAGKVLLEAVEDSSFDSGRFIINAVEEPLSAVSARGVANRQMEIFRGHANTGNEAIDRALKSTKFDPGKNINELVQDIEARVDTIYRIAEQQKVAFEFDPLKTFAIQKIPDLAAARYMLRGTGGARRWINKHLGADYGKAFWDALPNDIKGGIRIRAPFYRSSSGEAFALRIPGVGGGELTENLSKMGINILPVVEATERGRDLIRAAALSIPGVSNLMYKGRGGTILADAMLGATGKRRLIQLYKGDKSAFTDVVDYGDFNDVIWKSQNASLNFSQEIAELHYMAAHAMNKAFNIKDAGERRAAVEQFWDILGGQGPENILSQRDQDILEAAQAAKLFFDRFGDEAVTVTKDGRIAFNRLNNYAPRRLSERGANRKYWESPGYGGVPGSKTQNIKARRNDVELWGISKEGEAYALRFKGPANIKRIMPDGQYENIYLDDPLTVMADYAESFTRTLDDLRLGNMLAESGLLTRQQVKEVTAFDEQFIEESLVALVGGTVGTAGANLGSVRRIYDEILRRMGDSAAEAEVRDRSVAQFISDEIPNMGVVTRDRINDYVATPARNEFKNQLDGTTIRYVNGQYAAFDVDGTPMLNPSTGTEVVFDTRELVEEVMAEIMRPQRVAYWNNRVVKDVARTLDFLEEILENYPEGYHRLWGKVEMDLDAGLIDGAEAQRRKDALSDKAMEWLEKFGVGQEVLFDEKTGEVTWARGKFRDYKIKDEIRNIVEQQGLYDQQMIGAGGTINPRNKVQIQARIVEHIGTVYAPKAMMDTYVRMFQVANGTLLDDFMRSTYYPYYSMVRSWLTVGRGPGFVIRNVNGGMWNNYINGVGVVHHKASAEILVAKASAQKEAIKLLGEDATPAMIGQKTREIFRNHMQKAYPKSGTFIEGMDDAEALTEIFILSNKTGLTGGRSGRLANEQITYGNYATPGAFSGLTRKQREGILERYAYRRLPDADEPLGRTPTKREEILYKIGFDNPWIRDVMSPMAGASEDYLRLAAFIKGVQEMGLEPVESGLRGFSASTWVKGTQFDYQDLSYFEQRYLKNIMTFYTWARNNVPLQVRAFIHSPGHIANALRVHRNLALLFQDDSNELSPSYVNNQMMFEIDKSKFDWLPDIIEPRYDVAFGIPWADPIVDVNRWLKIPGVGENGINPIRRDELPQNLNPLITALWSLWEGTTRGPDFDERDFGELATWTRIVPGATRMNYGEAQLGVEGGTQPVRQSRRSTREFLTNILPQLGLAERLVPGFGDARQQNRLLTSWVSSMAGLPVVTVDDYQVAGQMRRDREGYRQALEEMFGDTAEYRIAMNKALMDRGATPDFLWALNAAGVPRNEVDVRRAQNAWELYRVYRASIDRGVDERDILASMYAYSGENTGAKTLVEAIWDALPVMAERGMTYRDIEGNMRTVTTDENQLYRLFAFAPATDDEKAWLGFTDEQIDDMTPAEQFEKIIVPLYRKRSEESRP